MQHIQRLIEQVDKLKGAMQGLKAAAVEASKAKGEEKGKEEEKEKKRKREEDEEEKASKKQKVEEKEENDEGEEELDEEDKMEIDAEEGSAPPPLSLGDVWKHVRLEPRFQVEEDDKEFAVTANIPNLNEVPPLLFFLPSPHSSPGRSLPPPGEGPSPSRFRSSPSHRGRACRPPLARPRSPALRLALRAQREHCPPRPGSVRCL